MRVIFVIIFIISFSAHAVNCSEGSVATASDSGEKAYFQNLYDNSLTASLKDYLHLWYPDREQETDNAWFFECQSTEWGPLDKMIKAGRPRLQDDCKPDVLYTWGPLVKLQNMKSSMIDDQEWHGDPNPYGKFKNNILYMAMTPSGTFPYGTHLIRLKIKKEVPFFEGDSYRELVPEVRFLSSFYQDFSLTDSSVIEGWSFGTPEIYDELVRDVRRLITNKRAQLYTILYSDLTDRQNIAKIFGGRIDSYEANEQILKERFHNLIGQILRQEGRVIYQKGTCRNRHLFFKTNKPTYFNPE